MSRILVHVEGQTEETFVNEVLAPHLWDFGYTYVSARIMGNARVRSRRGGIRGWDSARKDLLRHLKQDAGCLTTTMVDYYGLPKTGDGAWPGRTEASRASMPRKAAIVQDALLGDICKHMGDGFAPRRFLPFVLMHEFEALLFSDCRRFALGVDLPHLEGDLQAIRDIFATPEEINDSPITAPSKRVESLIPNYEKPFMGTLAAIDVGLEAMRTECPHFRSWLEALEQWPTGG